MAQKNHEQAINAVYYPARFTTEDDGYTITFRDIPEALSCGDNLTEAREMAADALMTAIEFYFEDNRPVPLPSALQSGEEWVALPAALFAKVLLLNETLTQNTLNSNKLIPLIG